MKPVICFLLACLLFSFRCVAQAQSPLTSPEDLQQAQTLLIRMLQAQKTLNISGDQVTVLYRPEQTFSASQAILREGDHALRLEYHSPDAVAGEVYVDNGRVAWHYVPSAHRLEVGLSGLGRFRQEANSIQKKLSDQELTAEIIGHDVVAGQIAQIVQVSAQHSWGMRRYWIDPVTGAQLKIQTFGALGQLVSQTYFTRIAYDMKFRGSDFGPPRIDSDVTTVPIFPPGSQSVTALPTPAQCGFVPMLPTYIPPGFTFQSGLIMPFKGKKMVGLTYANELITLSIFEEAHNYRTGKPLPLDQFKSPRQGVLTALVNGYSYILIGNLPQDVMRQVVQSMH